MLDNSEMGLTNGSGVAGANEKRRSKVARVFFDGK
jgi:hypothetical protein